MAMRVSVGRIIAGHGDGRKLIEPGVRFDSAQYGISDADLKVMEEGGTVRRIRDQTTRAPADGGPVRAMQEGATVEDRSGTVTGVTSDEPNKQDEEKPSDKAGGEPVASKSALAVPPKVEDDAASRRKRQANEEEL